MLRLEQPFYLFDIIMDFHVCAKIVVTWKVYECYFEESLSFDERYDIPA